MIGSGCHNCPVNPCGTIHYRGSACSLYRSRLGLGDPKTHGDDIRSMSDEELAALFESLLSERDHWWLDGLAAQGIVDIELREAPLLSQATHLDWLRTPMEDNGP